MEESILNFSENGEDNARHPCLPKVSAALDGQVVRMPKSRSTFPQARADRLACSSTPVVGPQ